MAPWWEFSHVTNELLLKHGIKYDHSLMHKDFECYYVRVGDRWTKIDYSLPADEWMRRLMRGYETNLIEIPANWYLDDLPPMMFIKKSPNSHGFVNPRDIEQMWRDQFDYVYREYDEAIFPITIHPDVSGRPQVLLMLERLTEYIRSHTGVRFCTFDEIADEFARSHPRDRVDRSDDNGAHWRHIMQGLDRRYTHPIVFAPQSGNLLFTASANTPPPGWRPSANCAIYRSEDSGESWAKLEKGLPDPFDVMVRQLVVDEEGDVYTAAGTQLLASRDAGDSWDVVKENLPHVRALAVV